MKFEVKFYNKNTNVEEKTFIDFPDFKIMKSIKNVTDLMIREFIPITTDLKYNQFSIKLPQILNDKFPLKLVFIKMIMESFLKVLNVKELLKDKNFNYKNNDDFLKVLEEIFYTKKETKTLYLDLKYKSELTEKELKVYEHILKDGINIINNLDLNTFYWNYFPKYQLEELNTVLSFISEEEGKMFLTERAFSAIEEELLTYIDFDVKEKIQDYEKDLQNNVKETGKNFINDFFKEYWNYILEADEGEWDFEQDFLNYEVPIYKEVIKNEIKYNISNEEVNEIIDNYINHIEDKFNSIEECDEYTLLEYLSLIIEKIEQKIKLQFREKTLEEKIEDYIKLNNL